MATTSGKSSPTPATLVAYRQLTLLESLKKKDSVKRPDKTELPIGETSEDNDQLTPSHNTDFKSKVPSPGTIKTKDEIVSEGDLDFRTTGITQLEENDEKDGNEVEVSDKIARKSPRKLASRQSNSETYCRRKRTSGRSPLKGKCPKVERDTCLIEDDENNTGEGVCMCDSDDSMAASTTKRGGDEMQSTMGKRALIGTCDDSEKQRTAVSVDEPKSLERKRTKTHSASPQKKKQHLSHHNNNTSSDTSSDQETKATSEEATEDTDYLEYPMPSTPQQKESRCLARLKQLQEMRTREMAESRRERALRRGGGGVGSSPLKNAENNKRVCWNETSLVRIFQYSPRSDEDSDE